MIAKGASPMMIQLAEVQHADWKSHFLSFLSDRLDQMEKSDPMESMDDISKALFNSRAEIMGQAALALIHKKFGHLLKQQYCPCPQCSRKIKAAPDKVKREITTLIGSIELHRPYFYCKRCKLGFYPFDEALGLCDRKVQPDVQALEALLAAEMPHETAAETLRWSPKTGQCDKL